MDIRRYFSSNTATKKTVSRDETIKNDKNKSKIVKTKHEEKEANDEDFKIRKRKKKPVILSDSESDEEPIPSKIKREEKDKVSDKAKPKLTPPSSKNYGKETKKSPIEKLKPMVSASDFFGSRPIQRSKNSEVTRKKLKKEKEEKNLTEEMEIHDDDDFIETLKQLDEMEQIKIDDASNNGSSNSTDTGKKEKKVKERHESKKKISPIKGSAVPVTPSRSSENKESVKKFSVENIKISPKTPKIEVSPVPNKSHIENNSTTPGSKEKNYANYRNYLQRAGPQALGSKEIPEGSEGCLQGLTFVITGVLDSLEREDAADIIKKYKGRVTQSVSKNTSYVIVGRDGGPSKLEKAEKLGIKQINEDEFLNLIREKSSFKSPSKKSPDNKLKTEAHERKLETKKVDSKSDNKIEDVKSKLEHSEFKCKSSVKNEIVSGKTETRRQTETQKTPLLKPSEEFEIVEKKSKSISPSENSNMSSEILLWVDKYKPTSCKQIIGQQGDRSNMKKLMNWLKDWKKNHSGSQGKKKAGRWYGNDDGSSFKAALLSGPPGIGKTTTATLVCKELGFNFIELNASDTRSKKSLQTQVQELLTNSSLSQCRNDVSFSIKHCLLMDEVDGMAGNEDRGGVQELIQLIKISKIPIICMCNDRNHPKIRSLSNYCFDLRFLKPRVEQLKAAMMTICYKEDIHIAPQALQEIIIGANQDVRQVIHHLSLWSANDKNLSVDKARNEAQKSKKDLKLNPFDTLKKVFSLEDHKTMNIHDKTELFFYDYSLSPLFVQENYVHMNPASAKGDRKKALKLVSITADRISDGDLIDKLIRTNQHWNLLPVQALFASVIPGDLMKCSNPPHQVTFPNWLGKNSRRNKIDRMAQELSLHTRLRISGNKLDLIMDYAPSLRDAIVQPLQQLELNGVHQAVQVLQSYDLLREDLENIFEISLWPGKENGFSALNPKVKAAFTRAYNSTGVLIPYVSSSAGVKRKKEKTETLESIEDEGVIDDETEDDDDENLTNDAMIKVKKPSKRQKKDDEPTSTSSRGKGRGKKSKN